MNDLQFELWIGDAAEIRTKRVRKQKTDRQDAQLLLRLMVEDRFPRIWVADPANRDLRQLLWHRHRLVQMRTRIMNQLHVVALNEGVRRKKALWRGRSQRTGVVEPGSVGQPTTTRPARLTRPADPGDSGVDASARRRSREATGSAATDDPPWSRRADGVSLRVGDWNSRPLSLRQANRQLCGPGSVGRVQRGSAAAGTHQQTRQLAASLPAGGSGAGHGTQPSASGAVSSFTSRCGAEGRSRR